MAAITTGMQISLEMSIITEVVGKICDSLDQEAKESVLPWISDIEEYSKQVIENLRPKDTQKKRADVLVAAAIYDAFLEFESRTDMPLGLLQLEKVLNLRACSISSTWSKLFDTRVSLSSELLDTIHLTRDQTIADGIQLTIKMIERADSEKKHPVRDWLRMIEKEALDLLLGASSDIYTEFDPMVVAVVFVYASMKFHRGKMLLKIVQHDLADLSGFSTSQVSKCWTKLFGS